MKRVYAVGTADTKGGELHHFKSLIEAANMAALLVNVGKRAPQGAVDMKAAQIAAYHPRGARFDLGSSDLGEAMEAIGMALANYLATRSDLAGVIGIGVGSGTSIITTGMRALAIGLPKLMVSTRAAAAVSQFLGGYDFTMIYSVTYVAGLNWISRVVLGNAAHAVAAMAAHPVPQAPKKNRGRSHDVWRHYAVRDASYGRIARGIRLPGISRHWDRRALHGKTRPQRHARRRDRCDDYRGARPSGGRGAVRRGLIAWAPSRAAAFPMWVKSAHSPW
jgi:Uncharacterised protein family (UPF0261)